MATLAQLQTWLSEAEIARHKLRLGNSVELRTYAGRSLKYTAANAGELDAYIADLEAKIAASSGSGKRRMYRIQQTGAGY